MRTEGQAFHVIVVNGKALLSANSGIGIIEVSDLDELIDQLVQAREHIEREKAGGSGSERQGRDVDYAAFREGASDEERALFDRLKQKRAEATEPATQDPDERRQVREALKAKVAATQNEPFNPDEAKGALGQMAAIVGRRCREERSLS